MKGKDVRAKRTAHPHSFWEENLSTVVYDMMLEGCDEVRVASLSSTQPRCLAAIITII